MLKLNLKYAGLVFAFVLTAVVKSSPLTSQMPLILSGLIVFAVISSFIQRKKPSFNILFSGNPLEIFFLTSIILFIIELTGGISSQLFFLNYFLLFGLPLISTPLISLIFSLLIIVFHVPDLVRGFEVDMVLKIGSVLLLLPLSYFLSKELSRKQSEKQAITEKLEMIEKKAEEMEAMEDGIDEREKLDEIINSAEELKDES